MRLLAPPHTHTRANLAATLGHIAQHERRNRGHQRARHGVPVRLRRSVQLDERPNLHDARPTIKAHHNGSQQVGWADRWGANRELERLGWLTAQGRGCRPTVQVQPALTQFFCHNHNDQHTTG
jgi:hypothetical protein